MPFLKHPITGGRFEVRTDAQVRYWARAGWVVDDDQSPIDAPSVPEPVAPAVTPESDPEPEPAPEPLPPAATATRTTKKEK